MSASPLLDSSRISEVQAEIRAAGLDGWLLYEFHGLNPIATALLGLGKTTRRAFVLVPDEGEPVALVHAIERSAWRHWPFEVRRYAGWKELETEVAALVEGRARLAMEVSPGAAVPTLDCVPAGTVGYLLGLGIEIASSGDLVSRFHSAWTPEQLDAHRKAAELVAGIARAAFERAADAVRAGRPTTEARLADWIREELGDAGLVDQADCIVAVGRTASDPHYAPVEEGEVLEAGQLVLIDLWGAFAGSVPADQTWMGMLGPELDARAREVWEAVRDARDAALDFLRDRHRTGEDVHGYEVDDVSRAVIVERGFGDWFVHRTGHSIDTDLHGSGPNLDNLETRDDRRLVTGVGFSVEPGIYLPGELGMRTEVDVYWGPDGPEVTPGTIQDEIFLLLER